MVEPPRALLDCFWGKAPSAAAAELKAALAAGCGRVTESSLPRLALAEWGASRQRIPFSAGPRGRPLPTPLGSAPCPLCSPGGQAPAHASRGRGSLPKGAETHAPETGPGSRQECRLDCSLDVRHLSLSLVLNPCQRGSVVLWRKEETSWIWTRCNFFCQGTHRITGLEHGDCFSAETTSLGVMSYTYLNYSVQYNTPDMEKRCNLAYEMRGQIWETLRKRKIQHIAMVEEDMYLHLRRHLKIFWSPLNYIQFLSCLFFKLGLLLQIKFKKSGIVDIHFTLTFVFGRTRYSQC
nr:uncharacterized protein LOC105498431 [Macaca nemestrina]